MSLKRTRHPDMNLNDLDYSITLQICQNFDVDRSWEILAGSVGYSTSHLHTFELEVQRPNGSPTRKLLWDWGSRGGTVRELYDKLALINRTQCMKFLQHIVEPNKGKENKPQLQHGITDMSAGDCLSSKSDNCLVSSNPPTINLDVDSLPVPSMKKNTPKPSNMVDVNLNTMDQTSDKPGNKLAMSDKRFDAILDQQGASSMEMFAHADGPAVTNGNLGAASSAAKSFDRIRSVVEEYGSEAPYMSQFSQDERDIAQALLASPNYTYKELSAATDGFSAASKLGQGKFGAVYFGLVKNTKCAIKKLLQRQERVLDEDSTLHMSTELKTLSRYRQENIVSMYGYALDNDEVCLVYQFMPNGSLYDCLFKKQNHVLTWQQRISILRGAACGLQFLHSVDKVPVIHGDIKSANVLLDRHFEAKIGDLGLAKSATGGEMTGRMTHITKKTTGLQDYRNKAYHPPEIARGNGFSVKGDTYSFGVVIYECLTGQEAYEESRQYKYLVEYIENTIEDNPKLDKQHSFEDKKLKTGFTPSMFNQGFQLASKCTAEKKKDRPSMVDVFKVLDKCESEDSDPSYYNIPDINKKQPSSLQPNKSKLEDKSVREHHMSVTGPASSCADLKSPSSNPSKGMLESPIDMLPKGQPIPEAFKLQFELDQRQKQAQQVDYVNVETISSKIKANYVSDPKKLSEIEKFDEEFVPAPPRSPSKSPIPASQYRNSEPLENTENIAENKDECEKVFNNDFEYELATDPQKVAKLEEQNQVFKNDSVHTQLNYCENASENCPDLKKPVSKSDENVYNFDEEFEKELKIIEEKGKGGGLMMGIFNKFEENIVEENVDLEKSDITDEEEFDFQFDFEAEDSETSTITESVNNDIETLNSGDVDENELFESGDHYVNVPKVIQEDKEDNLDHFQKKLKVYQSVASETEDYEEFTERSAQSDNDIQKPAQGNQKGDHPQDKSVRTISIQELLQRREPTECDCEEYV